MSLDELQMASDKGMMAAMRRGRRSNCPVACTLDILGDRWTLLLVRDMLLGKERFDDFLGSPEGVATNILAGRLLRLTEAGIVEQRPNPHHLGRATYHLTERGDRLKPVLDAMVRWGLENLPSTRVGKRPSGASRQRRVAKARSHRRRAGQGPGPGRGEY